MKLDLVDVFGSRAMAGNPLGVVHGGEGLSTAAMLELTRWLGFSETTFLLPPTDAAADYRVRIFYPADELDFAGHPTLGTCHAWLAAGGVPKQAGRIVQQCGIGLVEIREDGDRRAFRAPTPRNDSKLTEQERAELTAIAGLHSDQVLDAVHVDNGTEYKLLRLATAAEVLAAEPNTKVPPKTNFGLIAPCPAGSDTDFEIRGFFTDDRGNLIEDPITGSLNATTAQYMFAAGLAQSSYTAAQGRTVGADGRIHCKIDDAGDVWVGGQSFMIAAGADISI